MTNCINCGYTTQTCKCDPDTLSQSVGCPDSYPECNTPEKCSEVYNSECVVWEWDSIVGSLGNVQIPQGLKFPAVIQRLLGIIQNPGCNYPASPCLSVVGFRSTKITQTTARLEWFAGKDGSNYQIQYKEIGAANWTVGLMGAALTATIAGLTPNTEYMVKVVSSCGANTCDSLIIKIKTKTS